MLPPGTYDALLKILCDDEDCRLVLFVKGYPDLEIVVQTLSASPVRDQCVSMLRTKFGNAATDKFIETRPNWDKYAGEQGIQRDVLYYDLQKEVALSELS